MSHRGAAKWLKGAPLFAALGGETRLRVVARLRDEGPLSIAKLTEGTSISRQAVTKHLRVLEQAGIVTQTRRRADDDARQNVYQLEPRRLEEARRLLDAIGEDWDE